MPGEPDRKVDIGRYRSAVEEMRRICEAARNPNLSKEEFDNLYKKHQELNIIAKECEPEYSPFKER